MCYRVLFISSWFPNRLEPTNGNFVHRHAQAASVLDEVEALHAIGDSGLEARFEVEDRMHEGVRVVTVYYKKRAFPIFNFLERMRAYRLGFGLVQRPDVVHANVLYTPLFFAVWLKKRWGIPYVVTEHWTALRKKNRSRLSWGKRWMARYLGNQSSLVLPVSRELSLGLQTLGIKREMKVIPNVVDTGLFVSEKRADLATVTFLHVSNLIRRKKPMEILDSAIRLMKKGYRFRLEIGGDGSEDDLSALRQRAWQSGFGEAIVVFGAQTLVQVAERMRRCDYFILFSEDENQPCVIAEAFSCGTKVISTDVGGVSEFFPDGFGWLLEKPDSLLLRAAMAKALEEKGCYDREKIRAFAQGVFSPEAVGRQFHEVYKNVLKDKNEGY